MRNIKKIKLVRNIKKIKLLESGDFEKGSSILRRLGYPIGWAIFINAVQDDEPRDGSSYSLLLGCSNVKNFLHKTIEKIINEDAIDDYKEKILGVKNLEEALDILNDIHSDFGVTIIESEYWELTPKPGMLKYLFENQPVLIDLKNPIKASIEIEEYFSDAKSVMSK